MLKDFRFETVGPDFDGVAGAVLAVNFHRDRTQDVSRIVRNAEAPPAGARQPHA